MNHLRGALHSPDQCDWPGWDPVSIEEMKPDWETLGGRGGHMFERRQQPLATLWRFAAFLQIEGGREEVETEGEVRVFPARESKCAAEPLLVAKRSKEYEGEGWKGGWNNHFSAPGPTLKSLLFCPTPYSPP